MNIREMVEKFCYETETDLPETQEEFRKIVERMESIGMSLPLDDKTEDT
jgi:hypothetical protein